MFSCDSLVRKQHGLQFSKQNKPPFQKTGQKTGQEEVRKNIPADGAISK
jgi:hypothetical protein